MTGALCVNVIEPARLEARGSRGWQAMTAAVRTIGRLRGRPREDHVEDAGVALDAGER